VNGVVLDVGVSSPQMDDYSRGFSLNNLGKGIGPRPLDLRMNAKGGMPASDWLRGVTVEELAWVFREFTGGRRVVNNADDEGLFAERLAQAVMDDQEANGPYNTINRFAEIIGKAVMVARGELADPDDFEHPTRGLDHPARVPVQAIRTFLNDEVLQLEDAMPAAMECLAVGGRLLVAVFKPGESDVVKRFCLNYEEPPPSVAAQLKPRRLRELYPLAGTSADYSCQLVVRDLKPSGYEINSNNRARSGALWVIEKAARTLRHVKAKPRTAKSRFKMPPRPILTDGLPDRPDLHPA